MLRLCVAGMFDSARQANSGWGYQISEIGPVAAQQPCQQASTLRSGGALPLAVLQGEGIGPELIAACQPVFEAIEHNTPYRFDVEVRWQDREGRAGGKRHRADGRGSSGVCRLVLAVVRRCSAVPAVTDSSTSCA